MRQRLDGQVGPAREHDVFSLLFNRKFSCSKNCRGIHSKTLAIVCALGTDVCPSYLCWLNFLNYTS